MNKNREKQVAAILDELIKDKPEIILKLAVSEIWAKGTTHFSDKTLNATIGYWEEEQQKNTQRNQIISVDVQISVYRNKEKDKLFKVAAERVKKYEWENDDIAIIAPKQASDVVNDAHTLSHCAASFLDPIINGTENIMFIRKKNMKDVPWYTMAIDNSGNIEQIHSYQNSHLTIADQQYCLQRSGIPSYMEQIDIIPMLKKWAKEKGINAASIKERYGALCARH